jgi:hypothetical protein
MDFKSRMYLFKTSRYLVHVFGSKSDEHRMIRIFYIVVYLDMKECDSCLRGLLEKTTDTQQQTIAAHRQYIEAGGSSLIKLPGTKADAIKSNLD